MKKLSHLDGEGRARMVDVGAKAVTSRRAVASAEVVMAPETLRAVSEGTLPKGDVAAVARIAGIQGAKLTPQLIPLCHPLPLDQVEVRVDLDPAAGVVRIVAQARTRASTGVEMEALAGAAVAGLTVVDMVKGVDRAAHLAHVWVELKEGGKSGRWQRDGFVDPWAGDDR